MADTYTIQAVLSFQKYYGLDTDGEFGKNSLSVANTHSK